MVSGDETGARESLALAQRQKTKLIDALQGAKAGKLRVEKMEENLEAAEIEVRRIEALMARAVELKFSEDSGTGTTLGGVDPLLEKFRRLEEGE